MNLDFLVCSLNSFLQPFAKWYTQIDQDILIVELCQKHGVVQKTALSTKTHLNILSLVQESHIHYNFFSDNTLTVIFPTFSII